MKPEVTSELPFYLTQRLPIAMSVQCNIPTRIIHTKSHCEPEPKARAWQSLIFSGKNEIASATKVASQ
uniref:Uncharacterized protein n=1 Tax=candidate division WOR-3 bacterium TaxID=2052148 RepID=A0A7C4THQ6_UNCW3